MERLIPLKEFLEITGVKKTMAYNKWNKESKYYDPRYPKPVHRSGKLLFSYQQAQAYVNLIVSGI